MKFPYGIRDFKQIVTEDYFYCDRTDRIPLLEKVGDYLLFIRPRRFGKSLLLSMLANYYDVALKDQFHELFGHLRIGRNPTPSHGGYFVLKWDFSCVDATGGPMDIRRALHKHVNSCIRAFAMYYEDRLSAEIEIDPDDAVSSVSSLVAVARKSGCPVCLLIDEYDNFANEVIMEADQEKGQPYEALVHKGGPVKTLFKVVKAFSHSEGFAKTFITGVSPVVISDITSGYNIAENIYLKPAFGDLCGFTEAETEAAVRIVADDCGLEKQDAADALDMMRTWYDGYRFSPDAEQSVYNPTLAIYFVKGFQESCKYPKKMLDANLAADEAKLEYVSRIPGGSQMLFDMMREDHRVVISDLADRFGIREMLTDRSRDRMFMASLLYYFGVLTVAGETSRGKLELRVPNLVMRGLYMERIRDMLLPKPAERDEGRSAAEVLYTSGDMRPLCEFVEQKYFQVFRNRDYVWANELTVKTAFLTLLYDEILYIMDSEREVRRGYTDLTMIVRPDKRRFDIFDVLIEFKYVSLEKAGTTGEKARNLSPEALRKLAVMRSEMRKAEDQVRRYGNALELKYDGRIRLRRYAVVSLGFERLWWKEI